MIKIIQLTRSAQCIDEAALTIFITMCPGVLYAMAVLCEQRPGDVLLPGKRHLCCCCGAPLPGESRPARLCQADGYLQVLAPNHLPLWCCWHHLNTEPPHAERPPHLHFHPATHPYYNHCTAIAYNHRWPIPGEDARTSSTNSRPAKVRLQGPPDQRQQARAWEVHGDRATVHRWVWDHHSPAAGVSWRWSDGRRQPLWPLSGATWHVGRGDHQVSTPSFHISLFYLLF